MAYYDEHVADLNLLFEMGAMRKATIAAEQDRIADGLEPEHRRILIAAAEVYRKFWWPDRVWHVALFYPTGEVVRQELARLGIAYTPYAYKAIASGIDRDRSERQGPSEA